MLRKICADASESHRCWTLIFAFQAEVVRKVVKREEPSKGRYAFQVFKGFFIYLYCSWNVYPRLSRLLSHLSNWARWKGPLWDPSTVTCCYFFQAFVCSVCAGRVVYCCRAVMFVISLKSGAFKEQMGWNPVFCVVRWVIIVLLIWPGFYHRSWKVCLDIRVGKTVFCCI